MTEVLLIGGQRSTTRAVAGLAEQLTASGFTVRVAYAPGPGAEPVAGPEPVAESGPDAAAEPVAESGPDAAAEPVAESEPTARDAAGPNPASAEAEHRDVTELAVAEARPLRMSLSGRRGGAPLRRLSTPWGKVVARNAVVRAWLRIAGPTRRTWLLARYDPWLRRTAKRAGIVLAADDAATLAAEQTKAYNPDAVVLHVDDPRLDATLARARTVLPLQRLLRGAAPRPGISMTEMSPEAAADVIRAWREVEADPDAAYLHSFVTNAIPIVQALRRAYAFDAAEAVANGAMNLVGTPSMVDRLRLELATVRITRGEHPDDLADAVRAVLLHADASLRRGRMDEVASMLIEVVDAIFNRELHADVLWSPLVSEPAQFLAPLRESLTFRVLGAPAGSMAGALATIPAARSVASGANESNVDTRPARAQSRKGARRLLVVPGDYPHFTRGIIDTFDDDSEIDLRVLNLREPGPPRRYHRAALFADRLNSAAGRSIADLAPQDAELLGWADTIFVDWCDNAAQWTVMHAPPGARIVIRFHSLEAISHQPHMIDWSRVSDVLFVGHHVRQLVERAVPNLARAGRIHVVPNEMRLDRFGRSKRPGAERTIAMIGWAQRVKDPLWALEVLARLRTTDPTWRLVLFGRDFSDAQHHGALRYRDKFRERAADADVRDGLVYAGYTTDLPDALRDAGFVLSASRREGFPVGVTEGAASAAVPIIRDWPMYADYDGARGLFPADWVVDRTEQAVERILAYAGADKRTEAGEDARDYVVGRYDWSVVGPRFRTIVLGS